MESGNDFEFLPPPKFPDFSGEIERMKDALMKAHGAPAHLISISAVKQVEQVMAIMKGTGEHGDQT
jgi:hypothetical protein